MKSDNQHLSSISFYYTKKKVKKNAVQTRKTFNVYGEGVLTVFPCQNSRSPVETRKGVIKVVVDANQSVTIRKIGLS